MPEQPKTVGELIDELRRYPREALAYAYEGEATGVVVIVPDDDEPGGWKQLGIVDAYDSRYQT